VLHYDHETDLLWLFYTHSTVCSSLFASIKALRYAPGGDIRVRAKSRLWLSSRAAPSQAQTADSHAGDAGAGLVGCGTAQYTTTRDGVTWSHPRTILTQDSGGMIPKVISNQMIVHSSGAWILPYWREQPRQGSKACTPVSTAAPPTCFFTRVEQQGRVRVPNTPVV
jgi:hypothetical protein